MFKHFKLFILAAAALTIFLTAKALQADNKPSATPQTINRMVETVFAPPKGYERVPAEKNSFAAYLRKLPLKEEGEPVLYYNGRAKKAEGVYAAAVNMPISKKDLHQCADAVIRLYAEYLYSQKRFAEIKFNFISDGKPRSYETYAAGDYSYSKFLKYLDFVFNGANTASLYNQLTKVPDFETMKAGDVFIQKGNPYGHAVIVVDMAVNNETKEKVYLLAQSYMPAQETQILLNPSSKNNGVWYELKSGKINTPEWTFEPKDLRHF